MAFLHGRGNLWAGRVHHCYQPQERQVTFDRFRCVADETVGKYTPGNREHAQAAAGVVIISIKYLHPLPFIQGPLPAVPQDMSA